LRGFFTPLVYIKGTAKKITSAKPMQPSLDRC
jgi:hypothetical protein